MSVNLVTPSVSPILRIAESTDQRSSPTVNNAIQAIAQSLLGPDFQTPPNTQPAYTEADHDQALRVQRELAWRVGTYQNMGIYIDVDEEEQRILNDQRFLDPLDSSLNVQFSDRESPLNVQMDFTFAAANDSWSLGDINQTRSPTK